MNSYLDIAIEAAREAGAILRAELDHPPSISYKGEGQTDIVTQADRRAETAVISRLRMHFPKHTIIGEEGTGHEHFSGAGIPAGFRWYVDPLDGTTNFAHGYPCFAVSIGLAETKEAGAPSAVEDLLAGVVYNPVSDELFSAAHGEGAHLNQKQIHVSSVKRISESLLATGFPQQQRRNSRNIHYYWRYTLASHGVRRDGSAALDLCSVACGRFEGFWEFGLNPWDTAAGILILQEAGGRVTELNGRPHRLGGKDLLASNGHIHTEMQELAAEIAGKADQSSEFQR
ncbi:MAG: inositol monophosphatase [Acidobacteria bacterium]|nr:inositol monophosphatase [Acidobacteriota bacterium]